MGRIGRWLTIVAMLGIACEPVCVSAQSGGKDRRVALVIGNDAYQHIPKLENAVNDADSMSKELRDVGFEVLRHSNLDRRSMNVAIRDFEKRIAGGGVGVFFFAGHGVQTKAGGNLLLPVDVPLPSDEKLLTNDAVVLADVLEDLKNAKARFALAIIDACRDNPLAKAGVRNIGGTRGLAPVQAEGTMVIFSAGAGQQALDKISPEDKAKNSLFTREFIAGMREPNVPVDRMVKAVQRRVQEKAQSVGHTQRPAIYNESTDDFIFRVIVETAAKTAVEAARKLPGNVPDPDAEMWTAVRDSTALEDFQAYLAEYPKGKFARAAEAKVRQLSARAAMATPATATPATANAAVAAPPAAASNGINELLNEEVLMIEATGSPGYTFETTYYRPKGTGPFPTMVYFHGYQSSLVPGALPRPTPKAFALNAVARGYAVVVPALPGYGKTKGSSEIANVRCNPSNFYNGIAAMAKAFLTTGLNRAYIDKSRVVLVGTWAPSVLAESKIDGVQGVIQTLGAMRTRTDCEVKPGNTAWMIDAASRVRIPELWLYPKSEPRLDLDAVAAAVAKSAAVQSGLLTFVRIDRPYPEYAPAANDASPWREIEGFLAARRLPTRPDFTMLATLSKTSAPEAISAQTLGTLPPVVRDAYSDYLNAAVPKAFALDQAGGNGYAWYFGTSAVAVSALARCEVNSDRRCVVAAATGAPK